MRGKAGKLLRGLTCLVVLAGSMGLLAMAPDTQHTSENAAKWVYLRLAFPIPQ